MAAGEFTVKPAAARHCWRRAAVSRAWPIGRIGAAAVDSMDRLAKDIGGRLIERTRLPLVDQVDRCTGCTREPIRAR